MSQKEPQQGKDKLKGEKKGKVNKRDSECKS